MAALALSGCGGGEGEQQVLKKYFDASRMRDNVTAGNIATVSFRPQEEGIVQSFSVVSIAPESRRTLRIKEVDAAYAQTKQQDDEFTKAKKEYQDKNIEAIDRVLRAERENKRITGKDADVQREWTKWREDTAAHAKRSADARRAASVEKSVAELSVYDARNPVNIADYDGELITKDVTISARVRTPDNQTVDKQMVVTLQRAELKNAAGDARSGRWIITEIK
jgi:hypothetical protein